MDITIHPGKLSGEVTAIPSKSQAHRLLICAAFADGPTTLHCPETNRDIEATAGCLNTLGAQIVRTTEGYFVLPANNIPECADLDCHDSGSTLRFLLPICGALGVDATFHLEGRLSQRPLSPLWEEMVRMGCNLSRPSPHTVRCQGRLHPGLYTIEAGISSQFITGLLFAAALIPGESQIHLTGKVESRPYIAMTQQAMALFGKNADNFILTGGTPFHTPGKLTVEGDWSNAAFFLAAKNLGNDIKISNLNQNSPQGDRVIEHLLEAMKENTTIDASDIPDLIPILSVVSACKKGAVFTNIQRLRLKESDRVASVIAMLEALGGKAEATADTLTVYPVPLCGGTVDSRNDHRIAMSAAIAATQTTHTTTILDAECVQKSYPKFFDEYRRLGGHYEQYLR